MLICFLFVLGIAIFFLCVMQKSAPERYADQIAHADVGNIAGPSLSGLDEYHAYYNAMLRGDRKILGLNGNGDMVTLSLASPIKEAFEGFTPDAGTPPKVHLKSLNGMYMSISEKYPLRWKGNDPSLNFLGGRGPVVGSAGCGSEAFNDFENFSLQVPNISSCKGGSCAYGLPYETPIDRKNLCPDYSRMESVGAQQMRALRNL